MLSDGKEASSIFLFDDEKPEIFVRIFLCTQTNPIQTSLEGVQMTLASQIGYPQKGAFFWAYHVNDHFWYEKHKVRSKYHPILKELGATDSNIASPTRNEIACIKLDKSSWIGDKISFLIGHTKKLIWEREKKKIRDKSLLLGCSRLACTPTTCQTCIHPNNLLNSRWCLALQKPRCCKTMYVCVCVRGGRLYIHREYSKLGHKKGDWRSSVNLLGKSSHARGEDDKVKKKVA